MKLVHPETEGEMTAPERAYLSVWKDKGWVPAEEAPPASEDPKLPLAPWLTGESPTVAQILEWVGGDEERAAEALVHEEANQGRVTLIEALEELL